MLRIPFYTLGNWKLEKATLKKLEKQMVNKDYYDSLGNLYTSYEKDFDYPFGSFYEDRVNEIAMEQAFKNISKIRLSYWVQVYGKDAIHGKHTHFIVGNNVIISWVHFLKVPEKPCFRFTNGTDWFYPYQNEGDFLVFPSYVQHEVESHQEDGNRIVVAGNIYIDEHSSSGGILPQN